MRLFSIELGRPQWYAALLLLALAAQSLWTVLRAPLTTQALQSARCGQELWTRPAAPLSGGDCNLGQDTGGLAERIAGAPLLVDHLFPGQPVPSDTGDAPRLSRTAAFALRTVFVLFGLWLGGGVWWVSRRLYGNAGGTFALALYCFSPLIVRSSLAPNNGLLAAWGLYGLVYTAIGVAHAMQGPARRWRPRILLLTLALALTALAHGTAALFGLLLALAFMLYLARERWLPVALVFFATVFGAACVLFAAFDMQVRPLLQALPGALHGVRLSWEGLRQTFLLWPNAGTTVAMAAALLFFFSSRRAQYFGNIAPLVVAAFFICLRPVAAQTTPYLWALPFAFTFAGGVFADMLESRHRRGALWLGVTALCAQAMLGLAVLPSLGR